MRRDLRCPPRVALRPGRRCWPLAPALCVAYAGLAGCRQPAPDEVRRIPAPLPGLALSVETYYGLGAPAADVSRLYIEYARAGRRVRADVGSGEYLQDAEIRWSGPNRFVVCDTGLRPDIRGTTVVEADFTLVIHGEVGGPCPAAPPGTYQPGAGARPSGASAQAR